MSRELRDLMVKTAPADALEEKRGGLMRSGRVGRNSFRANAATERAQTSLGKRMTKILKDGQRGKNNAREFNRTHSALGYLDKRARRNSLRQGLSLGDR